jgi:hypothetical protein
MYIGGFKLTANSKYAQYKCNITGNNFSLKAELAALLAHHAQKFS